MNLTNMGSTSSLLYQDRSGYILFCCRYNSPNNCQTPSSFGITSRKITDVGRHKEKVKVISRSQSCLVAKSEIEHRYKSLTFTGLFMSADLIL